MTNYFETASSASMVMKHEFPSLISDKFFPQVTSLPFQKDWYLSTLQRSNYFTPISEVSFSDSDSSSSPSSVIDDLSSSYCSSSDREQSCIARKHRTRSVSDASTASSVTVKLVGTWAIDLSITPVRLELKGYFSCLLEKKQDK